MNRTRIDIAEQAQLHENSATSKSTLRKLRPNWKIRTDIKNQISFGETDSKFLMYVSIVPKEHSSAQMPQQILPHTLLHALMAGVKLVFGTASKNEGGGDCSNTIACDNICPLHKWQDYKMDSNEGFFLSQYILDQWKQ